VQQSGSGGRTLSQNGPFREANRIAARLRQIREAAHSPEATGLLEPIAFDVAKPVALRKSSAVPGLGFGLPIFSSGFYWDAFAQWAPLCVLPRFWVEIGTIQ